ncbi:hypothetical protein GJ496_010891 [Pomphorhynchus laevis]|nr:hypothetical protein GJ496_010891 [Pomphorhynchus laevis]
MFTCWKRDCNKCCSDSLNPDKNRRSLRRKSESKGVRNSQATAVRVLRSPAKMFPSQNGKNAQPQRWSDTNREASSNKNEVVNEELSSNFSDDVFFEEWTEDIRLRQIKLYDNKNNVYDCWTETLDRAKSEVLREEYQENEMGDDCPRYDNVMKREVRPNTSATLINDDDLNLYKNVLEIYSEGEKEFYHGNPAPLQHTPVQLDHHGTSVDNRGGHLAKIREYIHHQKRNAAKPRLASATRNNAAQPAMPFASAAMASRREQNNITRNFSGEEFKKRQSSANRNNESDKCWVTGSKTFCVADSSSDPQLTSEDVYTDSLDNDDMNFIERRTTTKRIEEKHITVDKTVETLYRQQPKKYENHFPSDKSGTHSFTTTAATANPSHCRNSRSVNRSTDSTTTSFQSFENPFLRTTSQQQIRNIPVQILNNRRNDFNGDDENSHPQARSIILHSVQIANPQQNGCNSSSTIKSTSIKKLKQRSAARNNRYALHQATGTLDCNDDFRQQQSNFMSNIYLSDNELEKYLLSSSGDCNNQAKVTVLESNGRLRPVQQRAHSAGPYRFNIF